MFLARRPLNTTKSTEHQLTQQYLADFMIISSDLEQNLIERRVINFETFVPIQRHVPVDHFPKITISCPNI